MCNQINAKISCTFFPTYYEVSSPHTRLDIRVTECKQMSESRQIRVDSLFNSVMDREKSDPHWHWYKTEGMMAQLGLQEVPQIEDGEWVSTFDHRLAYFTTQSLTFVRNASWSLRKCSAASMFRGSSKFSKSEKREDRPHSTSRRRLKYPTKMTAVALSGKYNLVGAQPNPSTECGLRSDRHISPSSEILGCHNLRKGQIFRL